MNCDLYEGNIMKYFDGNINHEERLQLEQHLKACDNCRQNFEQMDSILNSIERESAIEPPEDFEQQVMSKIRLMGPIGSKRFNILFVSIYGFAGMLIFTICSIFSYSVMGISIIKLINSIAGSYISTSEVINMVYTKLHSITVPALEMAREYINAAISAASEHYYLIVLMGVILFALQWMFISVAKQGKMEWDRIKNQ